MAGLADLLRSGGPELGPLELGGGLQAALAANPALLASSSEPVGQAIGQWTAATAAQPQALDYARRIAAVQAAAQNDLGKYLSAEDPVRAAAADTGGNPTARFAMMQISPLQLAQPRQATATAELERAGIPSRVISGAAGGGLLQEIYPAAVGGAPATSAPASAPAATAARAPAIIDPFANLSRKGVLKRLDNLPAALQRQFIKRFQPAPTVTGTEPGAG